MISVSVPFTRGTPPWPGPSRQLPAVSIGFSPLHEGDTSVAGRLDSTVGDASTSFSPLHEGDTSVARCQTLRRPMRSSVSVPFTRGTPPWRWLTASNTGPVITVSVPFTRGTPPWPHRQPVAAASMQVSVPFTRGTPPWRRTIRTRHRFSPLHEGDTSVAASSPAMLADRFQSPSRGGHLRGRSINHTPI